MSTSDRILFSENHEQEVLELFQDSGALALLADGCGLNRILAED